VRWPIGLQSLGGPDSGDRADELRVQIADLFQQAAEQAAKGSADPKLLEQITRAVDRFRNLLNRDRQKRGALPATVYDEAERFLNQLKNAEAVLQAGVLTPGAVDR
jgi:phosphoglycolate phosphatase-like HAD superfamily hydrolase